MENCSSNVDNNDVKHECEKPQWDTTSLLLGWLKSKTDNSKCCQGCGKIRDSHTLLVGMQNAAATLENSLTISQNVKLRITKWSIKPIPKYRAKRTEKIRPYRNFHRKIHCIIHNSQKVDTTQKSFSWWMEKQNGAYPYNGILFGLKRNGELTHAILINLENSMLN